MELTRRFIFRGNDVTVGGRIVRPDDIFLDPKSASSLPVTGGRTTGSVKSLRFGKYVRVASGMTLAEGVFDEQDVISRAHELADFIAEAGKTYKLAKPIAVGFSNGANIAAAILLLRPEALSGAILLRAMVPLAKPPQAELASKPVLIISGASDPIIPASNAKLLATMLRNSHAAVTHETLPTGHNLTQNDVAIASAWLNS